MPRMPQQQCDCHIPVDASEDVKLKILESKLKAELQMGVNFTTNATVGNLQAGTEVLATDTVRELLYKILYAEKALTSIAITSAPTKTSYTVGESFNPAGMVVTGYYSDSTSQVITGYLYTPTGPLTINDNKVTVSYGGKSVDQAITVSAPVIDIDIYYGATTAVPTSLDGLTKKTVEKTTLLSTNGYVQNIKSGDIVTGNRQHPVIAVPKTLSVYDCKVGGIQVITDFSSCESGNFKIYYQNTTTYDEDLGGTDFTFYIKEN